MRSKMEHQINDSLLIEQYKICTDMADKISQRRGTANKFYSALLLGFLSYISVIFKDNVYDSLCYIIILNLLGIAFSIIWILNIKSYRILNKSKYKVIINMEKLLPYRAFSEEWEEALPNNYISLSKIESCVPIIFIVTFILLTIVSIINVIWF